MTESIFISYSHRDEDLKTNLETHLTPLKRMKLIQTWQDRVIMPGDDFADEIDENLRKSDIVLLLISADFIASDYCYGKEMKLAMELQKGDKLQVVPIILRSCDWQFLDFARIQALPKNGKPVMQWPDRDEAFTDIAKGIRRMVEAAKTEPDVKDRGPVIVEGAGAPLEQSNVVPVNSRASGTRGVYLKEFQASKDAFERAVLPKANPEVEAFGVQTRRSGVLDDISSDFVAAYEGITDSGKLVAELAEPLPSVGLRQSSQYAGHHYWKWLVEVDADENTLETISSVTYLLPESFAQQEVTVTDRKSRFALQRTGWSPFVIQAVIRFATERQQEVLTETVLAPR